MIEASFEAIVPKAINAEFEAVIPREKAFDIVNKDIHIDTNGRYEVKADAGTAMTQVNVEVDIQPKEFKDVNFYDYEGTILHSYTWDEFVEKNEMPPLPTHHKHLVCQGWNYTLEEVLEQGGRCDVGAMYIPHGDKTLLIADVPANQEIILMGTPTVANAVIVDWGDGNTTINEGIFRTAFRHTYVNKGKYNITIDVTGGELNNFEITNNLFIRDIHLGLRLSCKERQALSNLSNFKAVVTLPYGLLYKNPDYKLLSYLDLNHVTIPRMDKYISVINCNINTISIPNNFSSIRTISYNTNIGILHIPSNATTYLTDSWYKKNLQISISKNHKDGNVYKDGNIVSQDGIICYITTNNSVFNGVGTFENNATRNIERKIVVMPNTLVQIKHYNFGGATRFFDFTRCVQIPTLSATHSIASSINTYKIIVPADKIDEYKSATNWSSFASRIAGATSLISYYVEGNELLVESRYTWQQMIDNNFNAYGYIISNGEVKSGTTNIKLNGVKVLATDVIQENANYTTL